MVDLFIDLVALFLFFFNIYIFSFSPFVSVYVYASFCDFACIALPLPFVLGFCLSVFCLFVCFFTIVFSTCYHWWICFFVWLLSSFFFFNYFFIFNNIFFILITLFYSFFPPSLPSFIPPTLPPFSSELCGRQALGAPGRHQACAFEVGEPNSGLWSTRDLPAPRNIKW